MSTDMSWDRSDEKIIKIRRAQNPEIAPKMVYLFPIAIEDGASILRTFL